MPWLFKKWLAKWVKKFSLRFSGKFPIYCIFSNKCPGRLFKNLIFKGTFIWVEHLFTNKHLAFFFDTRQAIEKTTNLRNYKSLQNCKSTNLLFDQIHFFIGILFIRGIMNGFTASFLSTKIDSFCLPASQCCPFFKQCIRNHPLYHHL